MPNDSFANPPQLDARGMGSPLGKFSCEVKTHLDEPTYLQWLRLCAEMDTTSSEFLRNIVYELLHQQTPAEMAGSRLRALLRGSAEVRR